MSAPPDEVLAAMAEAVEEYGLGWQYKTSRDRVRCALAAADALGWQLVPMTPTREMIDQPPWAKEHLITIYKRALAAAPKVVER